MIRITTSDDPTCTTITVDGQLLDEYVETIERCCVHAVSKRKPVEFLLRDVSTIDDRGRRLLWRLAAKGIVLKSAGIYSSYLIDGIKSARTGQFAPV